MGNNPAQYKKMFMDSAIPGWFWWLISNTCWYWFYS